MKKKKEVTERKIYRTDMKLLKRIIIGVVVIVFAFLVAFPVKYWVSKIYLDSWTWHEIKEFEYRVKLPRAYQTIKTENEELSELIQSMIKTETDVQTLEKYQTQKPKVTYYGGNVVNGISLMIQSLKTEKTTRSLDDIADSQHILVTVFYDNQYHIGSPVKEYVTIMGTDAIRTASVLKDKKTKEEKTIINYLVPMDDMEVTLTFLGSKENVQAAEGQIQKIVSQMEKTS